MLTVFSLPSSSSIYGLWIVLSKHISVLEIKRICTILKSAVPTLIKPLSDPPPTIFQPHSMYRSAQVGTANASRLEIMIDFVYHSINTVDVYLTNSILGKSNPLPTSLDSIYYMEKYLNILWRLISTVPKIDRIEILPGCALSF